MSVYLSCESCLMRKSAGRIVVVGMVGFGGLVLVLVLVLVLIDVWLRSQLRVQTVAVEREG